LHKVFTTIGSAIETLKTNNDMENILIIHQIMIEDINYNNWKRYFGITEFLTKIVNSYPQPKIKKRNPEKQSLIKFIYPYNLRKRKTTSNLENPPKKRKNQ
jgi:hypothetical protein